MSFAKFMAFLMRGSLWFYRIDFFDDPFEGKYPWETIRRYGGPSEMGNIEDIENMRQWTYANCWYMSDHESAAMWRLYASTNEAVAVQSTYEQLHLELPETCYVGEVKYIDFDRDFLDLGNYFSPFMHKRISFAHERELRALIHDSEPAEIPTGQPDTVKHDKEMRNTLSGLEINVDIHRLVKRIYVAPVAPHWFKKLIRDVSILQGFNENQVVTSSLEAVPY